jgi:hypothetical protein
MVRVTLEQLSRFKTLRDFFQKAPGGGRLPDSRPESAPTPQLHRYAVGLQVQDNVGGTANLNVWTPAPVVSSQMSLSQQWYVGGSGDASQTVECGWQVLPTLYGNNSPNLFIYWTADNYRTTGAYNLAGGYFRQQNSNVVLGGALASSPPGGPMYDYQMGYFLDRDRGIWGFYLSDQPVGYYPVSIFRGGALASSANRIDFGGEVACEGVRCPPMGSGEFASAGFGKAAYQRVVCYHSAGVFGLSATLSADPLTPQCYTIDISNVSGIPDWRTYFYFGGPGGLC